MAGCPLHPECAFPLVGPAGEGIRDGTLRGRDRMAQVAVLQTDDASSILAARPNDDASVAQGIESAGLRSRGSHVQIVPDAPPFRQKYTPTFVGPDLQEITGGAR